MENKVDIVWNGRNIVKMTAKSKTSEMFTVPIMNWFIITDERVSAFIVVISFRLLYVAYDIYCTLPLLWVTRVVLHVEQELSTPATHMNSSLVFDGVGVCSRTSLFVCLFFLSRVLCSVWSIFFVDFFALCLRSLCCLFFLDYRFGIVKHYFTTRSFLELVHLTARHS